jgi:hypothetical protein
MADTDERQQRASNEAVVAVVESRIVERVERMHDCTKALLAANITLDYLTASVLAELGENMYAILHEALDHEHPDPTEI